MTRTKISRRTDRGKGRVVLNTAAAFLILVFFLMPYLYLIISSFKDAVAIQAYPPVLFSFESTFQNYVKVFQDINLTPFIINSAIVATCNTALALLFATPAAYSLSRDQFRFKEMLAYTFLAIQMAPAIALIFSFMTMANRLKLYDTRWILIILYLPWNIPFAVWMLRNFVADIPAALEEAAVVDGCSRVSAFLRITLPLLVPGFMTTAIFIFIGAWNEFVIAFFLTSTGARTFPTTVDFFLTYGAYQFGPLFASAVIGTVPIAIFGLLVRKYYFMAVTGGALKG
jgi:multiple sugar transport system permease protein